MRPYLTLGGLLLLLAGCGGEPALLNVSFDATRELFEDVNQRFAPTAPVHLSNGGSAKQARAVLDGLEADVVTLGLGYDIDVLSSKGGLLPADWQARLPNHSVPYASTVVFVVRAGNPKHIHDWEDLAAPGVQVITPNPKTSGGGRWNYLAAWGHALRHGASEAEARDFLRRLYANVPVLDAGARGATSTFVQRGMGDVLVAWESEALLLTQRVEPGQFEWVAPSDSILAEPVVAVVDSVVDRRGTRAQAEAYLNFLYSEEGQAAAARHFFRPAALGVEPGPGFAPVELFTVEEVFGGWRSAQARHFDEGGEFDRLSAARL